MGEAPAPLVFEGMADDPATGVRVVVTIELAPESRYADCHELGEAAGAHAGTIAKRVGQYVQTSREVPF